MPKRAGEFQALIALVERQLAAFGVRVLESEMMVDRLTGEERAMKVQVTVEDPTNNLKRFNCSFVKRLWPNVGLLESVCENEMFRARLDAQH